MKKLAFLFAALLLLTACASQEEPPATTEAPFTEATVTETELLTETPTEAPTGAETTEEVSESLDCATTFEYAKTFIDKSVDELIDAIGEPVESYYEESCIGDGYDGILTYSTFTVFTFREADGSAETVVDAELND